MPMLSLFEAHRAYSAAKKAMIEAEYLDWPWDPVRDAVQAQGMRFCDQWKGHAAEIAEMVASNPERFPEFHIPDRKGYLPNPLEYQNHHNIMPKLVE